LGAQTHVHDPRNERVLVFVDGALVPRDEATVSVFDAGFVLGDGIWEALRVHRGALLFLDAHLDRLYAGARAIRLDVGLDRGALVAAVRQTLDANRMEHGVHVRVMVTRGRKATPNQDPRNTVGRATVVIVAEHKTPDPDVAERGLSLATSSVRCTPPDAFDMRLNSHSRLNLVTALLDAIDQGADEALMLDPRGFVSTCNSTNFFIVTGGTVRTSTGEYCFHGLTRGHVVALCRAHAIPVELVDFTLDEAHAADEAFVTGTFGGLTPVATIDGLPVGRAGRRPVRDRLNALYRELLDREARARGRFSSSA